MSKHRRYGSFLLRLWRTKNYGQPIWRASVEDPLSGERRSFAHLADLLAFLETWAAEQRPAVLIGNTTVQARTASSSETHNATNLEEEHQ